MLFLQAGNIYYFNLEEWNEAFTHKHHCGIVNLYPNQEGTRCIIVDTKNEAYLYTPVCSMYYVNYLISYSLRRCYTRICCFCLTN